MDVHLFRAPDFFRALSIKTYLWCLCVTGFTVLICCGMFMAEPVSRQIVISDRVVSEVGTSTDLDQTLQVRSMSMGDPVEIDFDHLLVMDNSLSKEEALEPGYLIATGFSEDCCFEESQANDGSLDDEGVLSSYVIEEIDESLLPKEDEVSINSSVPIPDYLALCQMVSTAAEPEDINEKKLDADLVLNREDFLAFSEGGTDLVPREGQPDTGADTAYYRTFPAGYSEISAAQELTAENEAYFLQISSAARGDTACLVRYGSHSFFR